MAAPSVIACCICDHKIEGDYLFCKECCFMDADIGYFADYEKLSHCSSCRLKLWKQNIVRARRDSIEQNYKSFRKVEMRRLNM